MKRFCMALDLKDDPGLIAEYRRHHEAVWPGILQTIRDAGIASMEIYAVGNRLFMIIDAEDSFSFAGKKAADDANPEVQAWETLMWKYQQALPLAIPGEKWMLMEKMFSLD